MGKGRAPVPVKAKNGVRRIERVLEKSGPAAICTNTECRLRKAGCRGFEGCPGYKGR
jgi:hypothetical protein